MAQEAPNRSRKSGDDSGAGVADVVGVIATYAKQETIDPLGRSLRSLGKGLAGAVLLAVGTVLLAIGFLRALEAEFGAEPSRQVLYGSGQLGGSWSWVPYAGAAVVCLAVAGWCGLKILKGKR